MSSPIPPRDEDRRGRRARACSALARSASALALATGAGPAAAMTYTASGPATYSWETTTTALPPSSFEQVCTNSPDDDEATIAFTGGFAFPMAGVNYTSARVFSNGQIQLGTDTGAFRTYAKTALPEANSKAFTGCAGNLPATNILSPAWLDLSPSTGAGVVSWQQKGSGASAYVVVSWTGVYIYLTPQTVSVQAILNQNGTIKFQYQTITGTTWASAAPTVGVQVSSTDYTAWKTTLANSTAVLFTPLPASSFNVVEGASTASTCGSVTETVTAKTSAGVTVSNYMGTINLITSTGHGTWSVSTGTGTFVAGAADSGKATYTFALADAGVATFNLADGLSETVTVLALASGGFPLPKGTSGATVFTDNSFVITPSDALGYQVVAGRAHAFTASFYKKDATTGTCSVNTGYTGSKALDMWYAASPSQPSGAQNPKVSASAALGTCGASFALPAAAPAVSASSNLITLGFSSGVATFYLCASDVGQYAIDARDDTLSYASTVVLGTSSNATVRPFGLWIDSVASGATANPGGTATAGSKFIPSQTAFSARATAKLWASGQDTALPGTPDATANLASNGSTPAFAAASTVAPSAQTPSGGTLGTLTGGAIAAASFSSGAATASLAYSEAGSAALTATSSNYLGSGFNVPGVATGPVGRFYPSSLVLASASSANACATGSFTYMGQIFPLAAKLQAVGSSGGVLANYDDALGYAFVATPAWHAVDALSGTDLGSRLSTGAAPFWSGGSWTFSYASAQFSRLAAPDGPYDSLQIGLSGVDADAAAIASPDMSTAVAGACAGNACTSSAIGSPMRMRFGQLAVSNAFGAVLPTLRVPVRAQYWNKSATGAALGWALNTLDSCTAVPYADMGLGHYQGGLSAATLPTGSLALSAGTGTIVVSRAGDATVAGTVDLGINLGASAGSPNSCSTGLASVPGASMAHLQSNSCSSTYAANPNAKIIWGAANAKSNATIMLRELY